ncbi:mechanosensitive ion channel [Subsaxibacter sp. CAU 1640]|uniref:mechanosensitive ion channel family protein n=1 Tax=Subsaxibacter sp. CAU 1640 TaxID=2933271 RepID=UPI002006407E|nr:mechanosensitive ion channel domain-containing protein [Subsaxibacter sp. CAU 1640]MCK7591192.1 mechanosensitive ion channel [Subsaxibacter sp. CAU 1640]
MEKISKWKELTLDSLNAMGNEIGKAIPNIVGAILVLVIGWLLTKFVLFAVKKLLKLIKIERLTSKINEVAFFGNRKLKLDITKIILNFIKWTMFIAFLIIASDIMNLKIISEEISNLLRYIPRLFTGLVIFVLGLLLANFLKNTVKSFFESFELSGSNIISQLLFLMVLVFATITALNQAGVNTDVITNNITLILGAFLLAFALALGLGAQAVAADLLRTFYVRKTYEIGQKIEYRGMKGEVEAIDNISMILKTSEGKIVIPIKNITESEIKIQN